MDWKISDTPVEYPDALEFMDQRVAQIHAGEAGDLVWLLEHPPLYTAGTSAKTKDLLDPRFPVFTSGRGGEYTYHGPGQRIAYVMMDLKKRQSAPDIKKYVWSLEEWIIRTLAEFGVNGERRCGRVGIWVQENIPHPAHAVRSPPSPMGRGCPSATRTGEGHCEKKIAAIGVRVRHWITLHGIAINIDPNLGHFSGIVPCGIADAGVTSLADLGVEVSISELDRVLQDQFKKVF
jgi:lipoyl(octanoyl) transferase